MTETVDLRSDTVTVPTAEMRRAMASAEVGDDCYGEDPTVNRLQELGAELCGKEAALYVPTGTMANQIALKVLSEPGAEVVCEARCHLIDHESGASARLSGVQLQGVPGTRGILEEDDVRATIRPDDFFQPDTACVAIENTHNAAGGTVWSLEAVEGIAAVARDAGVPLFCDGARLVNASVAGGTSLRDYSAPSELVTISLYKGLAAPMGSLLCGSREAIDEALLHRRVFGGSLRQAGIVAAAGIVGLETMIDRLTEDHANARRLAEGIADALEGDGIDLADVQTNMVVVDAGDAGLDAEAVLRVLRAEGVLAGLIGPGRIRFVTHKDVDPAGIDRATEAFARAVKEVR